MRKRKRIIVEARKPSFIAKYCIVGQVRKGWRWRDVKYFGSFRAAMDWIKGRKEEQR